MGGEGKGGKRKREGGKLVIKELKGYILDVKKPFLLF